MAPSNLQGLNIVHTAPPPNPYLSDQDLLSVPPFPDLSAQLDLWTNLNFQSDEPLIPRKDSSSEKSRASGSEDDTDRFGLQEDELQNNGKIAEASSHENVVTGTVIPPAPVQAPAPGVPPFPSFDIGTLLAGFGIDPFQVPQLGAMTPTAAAPSLAQLLSYSAAAIRPPVAIPGAQPVAQPAAAQASPQAVSQPASPAYPAPKRARTSRSAEQSPIDIASPESLEEEKSSGTPLSAAEDKRRRNTAASARFRLKKKEREAALERKAKELEVRVGELEKECEALRRENGWLKGLVVGVTGAGAVQQHQQPQVQQPATGIKRNHEESEGQEVAQQA
ncbi:hypothetical protein EIP86_008760 [Pleurotus ostreatoroseus]|nr:hypothetical protein EIP86_008760 [Pleurotus ostreatoroseus]